MLKPQKKIKVIDEFKVHKTDTGSTNVQIALLTESIEELTKHLKTHKQDVHSRRGLLGMVSKRKRLMNYLKKTDPKKYTALVKKLGLNA
ncbi:MAG: 30S ribosomal protein S15 [Minisyncoccia bacterium]|jgi:small subunit ribosomal protein S15